LATQKPVIGIDRFALYHALNKTKKDENILVVIQSKRAELFCKFFPSTGHALEPCLMTPQQIDAFVTQHPHMRVVGDTHNGDANIVAASAELAATADETDPCFVAQPLYLRAPDVSFGAAKSR
jgi:tRNA A37 threonylcarbamoyladenosine modification protein TsaB